MRYIRQGSESEHSTASVINIDPVVSGKHVSIRSSLQEHTRSASTRRRSMPDQPTGSIIMNTAVDRMFWWRKVATRALLPSFYRLLGPRSEAYSDLPNSFSETVPKVLTNPKPKL